jgi:putative glycosyltransferase (TIGR04372 family)
MMRESFGTVTIALVDAGIRCLWFAFYVFNILKKAVGPAFRAVPRHLNASRMRYKSKPSALSRGWSWLNRGAGAYARIPNLAIGASAIASFQTGTVARWLIAKIITDQKMFYRLAGLTEKYFRDAVRAAPLWIEVQRALGYIILFQGRRDEAIVQLGKAEALREELALRAGVEPDRKVYLPPETSRIMGGIGHIDADVKHRILNNDKRPYVVLAREDAIVNRPFLDYWRDYVTVITDPAECDRLAVEEAIYGVGWLGVLPDGDGVAHVHGAIAALQRQWSEEGRAPLLKLRDEHAELVAAQKRAWGMSDSDWFVCLHVRSSGFHGQKEGGAEDFRSAPLDAYYPTIRSIVESGGWVVRMGDPSMQPLDLKECEGGRHVIDYAVSAGRSAELDIALCASCRLFVGQSSGLQTVPHAFGTPCCLINIPLNAGFPWHVEDVFIPKLYFSTRENRILSLEEILSSTIVEADNQFLLAANDVVLVPNSADDILETVREALDSRHYAVDHEDIGRAVLKRFKTLNATCGTDISGQLGRYFAVKYAQQLAPAES